MKFNIIEVQYENRFQRYVIFFENPRFILLGQFLSILSGDKEKQALNRIREIISFIEEKNKIENFENVLKSKYQIEFCLDEEMSADKGKRGYERINPNLSTGFNLGKIASISYYEYGTQLFYRKADNKLIILSEYQSLDFPPYIEIITEFKDVLQWWDDNLDKLFEKKIKPLRILNYPMFTEESEKIMKVVDPNSTI